MALGGYDNVVKQGLRLAGLLEDPQSDGREGTSVVFNVVSKGISPKKIELRGRAVPYQKVKWGVSQRVNTIWYPGNPVASQQILGPEESTTEMNGMWKSLFLRGNVLVDGEPLAPDPALVVDLFAQLTRIGAVMRVTWYSEVRTGIIAEFVPTWHRETDCEWSLRFDWSSRNDEDKAGLKFPDDKKSGFDLLGKINEVLDKIAAGPLVAKQLVAMVVSDIREIENTVGKIIGLLSIVSTVLGAPAAIIGALKASIARLARQVNVAIRRIAGSAQSSKSAIASLGASNSSSVRTRTSAQNLVAGTEAYNPPAGIPADTANSLSEGAVNPITNGLGAQSGGASSSSAVSGQNEFESWRRGVAKALGELFFVAQQAVLEIEKRNTPESLRLVTVKEGDTLYSISVNEYGSPDYANWIAAANDLRSAILRIGTVLRIPSRPTGPSQEATIGNGDQIGPQGTDA